MAWNSAKTGTALTVGAGLVAIPWLVVTVIQLLDFSESTAYLRVWSTLLGAVCMLLLWVGLFIRWRGTRTPDSP